MQAGIRTHTRCDTNSSVHQQSMPKPEKLHDAQVLDVQRNGSDSEVVSPTGMLLFLLRRPWENRHDREWHFTLWRGESLFGAEQAVLQPLLTLIRWGDCEMCLKLQLM